MKVVYQLGTHNSYIAIGFVILLLELYQLLYKPYDWREHHNLEELDTRNTVMIEHLFISLIMNNNIKK